MRFDRKQIVRISALAAVLVCLGLGIGLLIAYQHQFLDFFRSLELWQAAMLFATVGALCISVLIPGMIFIPIAGFLFGFFIGILVVFVMEVTGTTLAFYFGRFIFRDWAAKLGTRYPKVQALDRAIEQQGWQLVILLRLTPLLPTNLLNYFLGASRLRFRNYAAGWIGMLPHHAYFVYLGAATKTLYDKVWMSHSGEHFGSDIWATIITIAASVILSTIVVVIVIITAKRILNQKLVEAEASLLMHRLVDETTAGSEMSALGKKNDDLSIAVEEGEVGRGADSSGAEEEEDEAGEALVFKKKTRGAGVRSSSEDIFAAGAASAAGPAVV